MTTKTTIAPELLDQLLSRYSKPDDLLGPVIDGGSRNYDMSPKGAAFFRRAELGCGVGQVEVEAGFVPDASLRRLAAELQALFP